MQTNQEYDLEKINEARRIALGTKIREMRTNKGLTQAELSEGNCTPSMISQIESGKTFPSFATLNCIADRLGVTYEALLKEVDDNLSTSLKFKSVRALKEKGSYEYAIHLADKIREELPEFEDTLELNIDKAECLMHLNRYDEARVLIEDTMTTEQTKHEPNIHILAQLYNLIGNAYLLEFNLVDAVANYSIAHKYSRDFENPDIVVAMINFNLGRTYEYKGDIEKAIYYYDTASDILKLVEVDSSKMADLYYAYAISYQKLGNIRVAEDYMTKAVSLYQANRDFKMVNRVRESTAFLISSKRDTFTSVQDLLECIVTARKLDDSTHVAYIYAKLLTLLLNDNKHVDASSYFKDMTKNTYSGTDLRVAFIQRVIARYHLEVEKNYKDAIKFGSNSSDLFDKIGMKREAGLSLKYVIEAYESLGEKDLALIASKKVIQFIE